MKDLGKHTISGVKAISPQQLFLENHSLQLFSDDTEEFSLDVAVAFTNTLLQKRKEDLENGFLVVLRSDQEFDWLPLLETQGKFFTDRLRKEGWIVQFHQVRFGWQVLVSTKLEPRTRKRRRVKKSK